MSSIEAKPTEYKGTLYRSRLEARWAVYLDHHPKTTSVKYEPTTFRYSGGNYTPDFYFFLKGFQGYYLEVKPSIPSQEYLASLVVLLMKHPISLLLAVGSFYKEEPVIYEINSYNSERILGAHLIKIPFLGDNYALASASGYRFDLAQPEAPRRKGHRNAKTPSVHKKRRRRRFP